MTEAPPAIVITGLGMRTAVGNTAVQTCASVRAGIARFTEWPHFAVTTSEDEDEEPGGVVAATVNEDFGDDPWTDKALELLVQPLYEAIWGARLQALLTSRNQVRLGIYLATPYADRIPPEAPDEDVELEEPDEDEGDDVEPEVAAGPPQTEFEAFVESAEQFFDELFGKVALKLFPLDHAAGLIALAHAVHELECDQVDIALVAGVDSQLDSRHLGELFERGTLKTDATSCGLIPGEAAAVLVLERADAAAVRRVTAVARVASAAIAKDAVALAEETAPSGQALAEVLRGSVQQAGGPDALRAVYLDLTGERARFLEWALVETRCMHIFPRGWKTFHPADCLGDVGAAFGVVAAGLAARAFQRGYAPSAGALICCSSQRGERSAACLFQPG